MSGIANQRVIVGVSGGVDSAVAALCLLRAGHHVEGLHMTNWEDADAHCTAGTDLADARQVCADLGITLHHVNFAREYRDQVFADFLRELRAGRTPNPDVACNRQIKFGAFLQHALRLGADRIATGHYARVGQGSDGRVHLLRPADRDKDQTYFLHAVDQGALARTQFPLGGLDKQAVRQLARDYGLSNHAKRDSTGICFVGERPFREFLAGHLRGTPGPILTEDGEEVGRHDGLALYTLGQRQGLGVGGRRGGLQAPWFVAAKDAARNALIVVQGADHPRLHHRQVVVGDMHWPAGEPVGLGAGLHARIRHRQEPAACQASQLADGRLLVRFAEPQRAPTPGQYLVLYRSEECLGGGVIEANFDPAGTVAPGLAATA
jgi:tRNA-specific 2-thiouridylase